MNYSNQNDTKRTKIRQKYLNFIDFLLPVYIILSMPLFYLGLHYEFLFKGFAILVTLFFLFRVGIPKDSNTQIFTIFLLLVTFSFIQYLYNNRPIACYITDASNYIAAMMFYYVGVSDDRPNRSFYKWLMYSTITVFSIGLICYILTPSWYVARSLEIVNASSELQYGEESMLEQLRFGAFWGDSYSVSHLSVFCIAIALFDMAYEEDRKKIIAIICLVIGLASSVASMHRASILGSILALSLFAFFNYKTHRHKTNIYFFLICVLSITVLLLFTNSLNERFESILGMLTERVDDNMSLNKALNERKFTKEVMSSMQFFIFGHGLGSGGGSVRAYGFPGINDMQYIKMFFENGVVGAILFISIITRTLYRGFKYIRYYLTELAIIMFILVAMLGSNSLSIYYFIVIPFWYAVGRVNNLKYFKNINNKKWIS